MRRLALDMHEDCATWLKFANLCRKNGRITQSEQTLVRLLADVRADGEARGLGPLSPGSQQPDVMYAWYKHLWATGARQEAFAGVQHLAAELGAAAAALAAAASAAAAAGGVPPPLLDPGRQLLSAKVHMKLGLWRRSLTDELSEGGIASIMANLRAATEAAPSWGKAWHHWAYFNCEAMVFYGRADAAAAQRFVAPAVTGFFRSIELGQAQGGLARGRRFIPGCLPTAPQPWRLASRQPRRAADSLAPAHPVPELFTTSHAA